jgi:hypothetical protein
MLVRIDEVDTLMTVEMDVDETGNGNRRSGSRGEAYTGYEAVANLEVAGNDGVIDHRRRDSETHDRPQFPLKSGSRFSVNAAIAS